MEMTGKGKGVVVEHDERKQSRRMRWGRNRREMRVSEDERQEEYSERTRAVDMRSDLVLGAKSFLKRGWVGRDLSFPLRDRDISESVQNLDRKRQRSPFRESMKISNYLAEHIPKLVRWGLPFNDGVAEPQEMLRKRPSATHQAKRQVVVTYV